MDISALRQSFDTDLSGARSDAELRAVRDKYLSRKSGLITAFLKSVASAPAAARPALGQAANAFKLHVEAAMQAHAAAVAAARPAVDGVDVTLPGRAPLLGHRHPLSLLRERVEAIF